VARQVRDRGWIETDAEAAFLDDCRRDLAHERRQFNSGRPN